MRRFSLALLASVVLLAPLVAVGEGAPRAVPVQPTKTFEIIPRGETIHHTFEIKNEGDAPLQITDVKPACGCTVVDFDTVIQPGGTGKVAAKVETIDFNGPIAKSLAVFTNDPDNPKIQLVIKAEIKPFLGVTPGFARYSYVQGEEIRPISQLLWAEDGRDTKVLEIKTPYPHLQVSHREATEEERREGYSGKQWLFEVHLDPFSPVGALRDYVEVTTDHPKQKSVRIPISGFVRPRQHVTPYELDLGTIDGGQLPVKRVLAFTNFIKKGIEVTEIETGQDGMSVEANMVGQQDGHRFELILTLDSGVPKGDVAGTIRIHITDEKNPTVEVPFKGSII